MKTEAVDRGRSSAVRRQDSENPSRGRRGSLPAPLKGTSVTVERGVAALGAVAAGAGDALGPPDRLLRGVQQTVQHLADRAVLAVERVGVHVDPRCGSKSPWSRGLRDLLGIRGFLTRGTLRVTLMNPELLRRTRHLALVALFERQRDVKAVKARSPVDHRARARVNVSYVSLRMSA